MGVRGKSTRFISEVLSTFSAEAGLAGRRLYILANGRSLPLRDVVRRGSWYQLYKAFRSGTLGFVRLGLRDAKIGIKNSARLIYTDKISGKPLTAKIALHGDGHRRSLAREIKARSMLAARSGLSRERSVPVPNLIRYDRNLRWIEEDYIEDVEQIGGAEKFELFLKGYAKSLYSPMLRSRPLRNSLRRFQVSWPELQGIFRDAGATLPDRIQDATWPVSLLHGDLSTENMLVTRDGRLFVIDWDRCAVGPIAWDLKKFFRDHEKLVYELLSTLSGRDDLDPHAQMLVATALRIDSVRRNPKTNLADQRKRERALLSFLNDLSVRTAIGAAGADALGISNRSSHSRGH